MGKIKKLGVPGSLLVEYTGTNWGGGGTRIKKKKSVYTVLEREAESNARV